MGKRNNRKRRKSRNTSRKPTVLGNRKELLRLKANRLHEQAQRAWSNRRFAEAITLLENAVQLDNENYVLLANLARMYGLRYDFEKAIQLKQSLLDQADVDGYILYLLAESELKFRNFDEATRLFRRALDGQLDKRHWVRSRVALANVFERSHRLDEARKEVDAALARWPDHPKANLIRAKVLKRLGESKSANEIFKRLRSRMDVSPDVHAEAWFALAKDHEADQDFDAAFAAYQCSKDAYLGFNQTSRYEADLIRSRNEAMIALLTEDHLTRWLKSRAALESLPVEQIVWLIGHPRSGTTLLEQVLDSHERIVCADEFDIFASSTYPELAEMTGVSNETSITTMLDQASTHDLDLCRKDYLSKVQVAMRRNASQKILIDKNPELTLLLPVILRVFPEAKILFAVRDPRDVVVSCFTQVFPLNSISVEYGTIESAARKYATVMNNWLRIRDIIPGQWLEVRYEDSVRDLQSQTDKVCDFLAIDVQPQMLDFQLHSKKKNIHSPTYEAVTRPIYSSSIGRWKRYRTQLEPALPILQPFIEVFGYE